MAVTPTISNSGTQTCVISTTHTLATVTTAGVYTLYLDLNAIVGGTTPDILEVYIEKKVLSTGTTRQIATASFTGGLLINKNAQSNWYEVASGEEVVFKIKQTQGTGRAIPWEVITV